MMSLNRSHNQKTHALLNNYVVKTPFSESTELSHFIASRILRGANDRLFFKCENQQTTGSFKYRGAMNSLLAAEDRNLSKGVVTYSTGM